MSDKITQVRMRGRRAKVSAMILAGYRSIRGIARKLDVSAATICRDVKAIEKEWSEEVDAADRERHRVRELKKCDQMEGAITLASLGFEETEKGQKAEDRKRSIPLALKAQPARLDIMKRRAKLLGLDSETVNMRNLTPSDVLKEMLRQETEEEKKDEKN